MLFPPIYRETTATIGDHHCIQLHLIFACFFHVVSMRVAPEPVLSASLCLGMRRFSMGLVFFLFVFLQNKDGEIKKAGSDGK